MFEEAGLGRLIVRDLGLGDAGRRARSRLVAGARRAHQGAQAGPRDRPRRQVHRAARRLPVGHRGAPPRGLGARGRRQGPLGRFGGADRGQRRGRARRRRPASSSRAASAIAASRARSSPPTTPAITACPYLGLCLGLQCAVIEFAREVVGSHDANSTEFDMFTEHPVIDFMADQRDMEDKGGTMRLGLYPARLTPGSKAAPVYGEEVIYERHRHRFEVNNRYRQTLEARRACCCPASRRTAGSSRSSSSRTTRGSWPASSTRSSRAGRSARTRCSTGSSARRSRSRAGREPEFRARPAPAGAARPPTPSQHRRRDRGRHPGLILQRAGRQLTLRASRVAGGRIPAHAAR